MNNEKVDAVLKKYQDLLKCERFEPVRWPAGKPLPDIEEDGVSKKVILLNHCLWMCAEARSWGPGRLEKKQRWLGFIQGVLFSTNRLTIEMMKWDNKPPKE